MIQNKLSILAAYGMMAALSSQESGDILEYSNPYNKLPQVRFTSNDGKKYSKSPLTNKQKKSRAANKKARQQRKCNR